MSTDRQFPLTRELGVTSYSVTLQQSDLMAPTIRIDDDVWVWLKSHARPLEDTPNSVLRRLAGLELSSDEAPIQVGSSDRVVHPRQRLRSDHMSQAAFREPILLLLHRNGGRLERPRALIELERALANQLTDADRSDIESGTIRWQKNAEWQVHTMRRAGLLEPVQLSGNGVWHLTQRGGDLASKLAADESK